MQKKSLVLVIGALILAALAYYLFGRTELPALTTSSEVATTTYVSEEYGYTLDYPANLTLREYSPGNVVFGAESGEEMSGVVEVRVVDIPATPGQSLQEAATLQLQALCAADSPDATFSCPRVDQVQPFVSRSGIQGYVVYLTGEMRMSASGDALTIGKGPFFVLPLGSSATGSRVLVVHPPLNQTADDADAAAIRSVAESVRVRVETTRPAQSIEDFVRENIGRISPVAPSLGGTFYVTSLEARNGSGVVSYEDGHMAYTADFSYTVSAGGVPRISTFTVR